MTASIRGRADRSAMKCEHDWIADPMSGKRYCAHCGAGEPEKKPRRFRLTAPEPSEHDLHQACAKALDALLLPPAEWCTYPAGQLKLAEAEKARLARVGVKPGWPDILIVHRHRMFGTVYGIELKRLKGKLSKTRVETTKRGAPRLVMGQEEMFQRLRAAGMTIEIAHSVEEMLAQLALWGIPTRPHTIA